MSDESDPRFLQLLQETYPGRLPVGQRLGEGERKKGKERPSISPEEALALLRETDFGPLGSDPFYRVESPSAVEGPTEEPLPTPSVVAHPLLKERATKATGEEPGTTTEEPPKSALGTTGEETDGGTTVEDVPLIPSATVKKYARRLGFDADPLPTPTLVTLRLRCEVEMGLKKPYVILTAPIPASVGKHGRDLAHSIVHLFSCRFLKDPGDPAPLTIGFMTKWASMTEWEFREGKAQLVKAKWLVWQYQRGGYDYWLPRGPSACSASSKGRGLSSETAGRGGG